MASQHLVQVAVSYPFATEMRNYLLSYSFSTKDFSWHMTNITEASIREYTWDALGSWSGSGTTFGMPYSLFADITQQDETTYTIKYNVLYLGTSYEGETTFDLSKIWIEGRQYANGERTALVSSSTSLIKQYTCLTSPSIWGPHDASGRYFVFDIEDGLYFGSLLMARGDDVG